MDPSRDFVNVVFSSACAISRDLRVCVAASARTNLKGIPQIASLGPDLRLVAYSEYSTTQAAEISLEYGKGNANFHQHPQPHVTHVMPVTPAILLPRDRR
jgi:hypothetical protein